MSGWATTRPPTPRRRSQSAPGRPAELGNGRWKHAEPGGKREPGSAAAVLVGGRGATRTKFVTTEWREASGIAYPPTRALSAGGEPRLDSRSYRTTFTVAAKFMQRLVGTNTMSRQRSVTALPSVASSAPNT